ncbi:chloride channel protein [Lactococcus laudensis]|uniref:chloride channel protein n=1 Tax=Pseudolactococcus laudensis TaxID=1494461 RepID=UPI00027750CF|nr:Chloride channel protein [Lactococcus raffinolactis 4877]
MKSYYRNIAIWSGLAILIGLGAGVLDALFGRVLIGVTDFRLQHFNNLISFLPLIGVLIVFLYHRFGKTASQGMGLVFSVGHQSDDVIPKRLIPLAMVATWLTHLFGGSAGREGVAVQIGATFANFLGDVFKVKNRHIIVMIGMAAGFGGLFQTPFAATLFALEALIAGAIYYRAIVPALIASTVAAQTSHFFGLEKFSFTITNLPALYANLIAKLLLMGAIFGLTGFAFAWLLTFAKSRLTILLPNPYVKVAACGVILSLLFTMLGHGRYSGLGTNLITAAFGGGQIFAWDFALKLLLTVLTLAIGFQGGEVTPLLAIGAALGTTLGLALGLPVTFVAALGYAAVFAAATNTFWAPILIGCEVFGYALMPYLMIVVIISYMLNFNKSIYTAQDMLQNMFEVKKKD